MGAVVLDETMHKYVVSFCVSSGDTNGKGVVMVVSKKSSGPTFNNGATSVFSTIVLIAGTTLACVVVPCSSMVVMVGKTLAGVINPCRS